MLVFPITIITDDPAANAHQYNAMGYVSEAFAEALLDGIDGPALKPTRFFDGCAVYGLP